MTDEVRAAVAERMNRLPEVAWDRCSFSDAEGSAFGWIARDDGRSDFVVLSFQWGDTRDLDGNAIQWFAAGTNTSSAEHSQSIAERIIGPQNEHRDCDRVEEILGDLVTNKIELVAA